MRKTVEVQMDAGMEARPIALMVHDRCGRNRRSGSSGSIRETFDRQINVE